MTRLRFTIQGEIDAAPDPEWLTIPIADGIRLQVRQDRATDAYWQLHQFINQSERKVRAKGEADMAARKAENDTLAMQLLARYREVIRTRNEPTYGEKARATKKQIERETGRSATEVDVLIQLGFTLERRRTADRIIELADLGLSNLAIARQLGIATATVAKITGPQGKGNRRDR
jgi:DNA-binding NarL/FixJ family response regulator